MTARTPQSLKSHFPQLPDLLVDGGDPDPSAYSRARREWACPIHLGFTWTASPYQIMRGGTASPWVNHCSECVVERVMVAGRAPALAPFLDGDLRRVRLTHARKRAELWRCPECGGQVEISLNWIMKAACVASPAQLRPSHLAKACPNCGTEAVTLAAKWPHLAAMFVGTGEGEANAARVVPQSREWKTVMATWRCGRCEGTFQMTFGAAVATDRRGVVLHRPCRPENAARAERRAAEAKAKLARIRERERKQKAAVREAERRRRPQVSF